MRFWNGKEVFPGSKKRLRNQAQLIKNYNEKLVKLASLVRLLIFAGKGLDDEDNHDEIII